jgi:hypothetical protein
MMRARLSGRRQIWVVIVSCTILIVAYVLFPRRTDLWLHIRIRNQSWDTLKEAQLTLTDRSRQVLASAKLELSTAYDTDGRHVSGIAGRYGDAAERILDASETGLVVSISAAGCKPVELEVSRSDIGASYDPPYLQLGGHGTGYHSGAMHYRLYRSLDLEC